MNRYKVVHLAVVVLISIVFGCGSDIDEGQPVNKWIGTWQYMELKNGKLQPDGDKKITFFSDGTWKSPYGNKFGTYVVFENEFVIDTHSSGSKGQRKGNWTLDGNILKLVYDITVRVEFLTKTN